MDRRNEGGEWRSYRVTGRVQGVGFRWWTRKEARALGLVGRVRNEPDGSVDVRVAGETDALDALEARLWDGPFAARVAGVERMPVAAESLPSGMSEFEIERD